MLNKILITGTALALAMIALNPAQANPDQVVPAISAPLHSDGATLLQSLDTNAPAATVPVRKLHMLSNDELANFRGGESLTIANQTLEAVTQGNVINGDFTAGDVNLSDNALSNFTGIGNVLINTGAQVSLQAGMNLTINIGE